MLINVGKFRCIPTTLVFGPKTMFLPNSFRQIGTDKVQVQYLQSSCLETCYGHLALENLSEYRAKVVKLKLLDAQATSDTYETD